MASEETFETLFESFPTFNESDASSINNSNTLTGKLRRLFGSSSNIHTPVPPAAASSAASSTTGSVAPSVGASPHISLANSVAFPTLESDAPPVHSTRPTRHRRQRSSISHSFLGSEGKAQAPSAAVQTVQIQTTTPSLAFPASPTPDLMIRPSTSSTSLASIPGFSLKSHHPDDDTRSVKSVSSSMLVRPSKSAANVIRKVRGSEGLSRDYWIKDQSTKDCYNCGAVFTAWRRKHHCRICGQIFCSRCASHIISGSRFRQTDPIRVCNLCMRIMNHEDSERGDKDERRFAPSSFPSTDYLRSSSSMSQLSRAPQAEFAASNLFPNDIHHQKPHSNLLPSSASSRSSISGITVTPMNNNATTSKRRLSVAESGRSHTPALKTLTGADPPTISLPPDSPETHPLKDGSPPTRSSSSLSDDNRLESAITLDWRVQLRASPTFNQPSVPLALSRVSHLHLQNLLLQELEREQVPQPRNWIPHLMKTLLKLVSNYNNINASATEMSQHFRIKKVPGGRPGDSEFIPGGVVFTKNVLHKQMPRHLTNARIMLLSFPIEYQRIENQLVSLESLMKLESETLKHLVDRIAALRPHIVLVEGNVSRLALEYLIESNIAVVARNVSANVIEDLASVTNADIITSMDKLAINPRLGRCSVFRIQTFVHPDIANGGRKTLMRVTASRDESSALVSSLILRGGTLDVLVKVKKIMRMMCLIAYNAKLESHFLRDERMSVTDLPALLPSTQLASFDGNEQLSLSIDSIANRALHKDRSSLSLDIVSALEPFEMTLISGSAHVHFDSPYPLVKMKDEDLKVQQLKEAQERVAEDEELTKEQDENDGDDEEDEPQYPDKKPGSMDTPDREDILMPDEDFAQIMQEKEVASARAVDSDEDTPREEKNPREIALVEKESKENERTMTLDNTPVTALLEPNSFLGDSDYTEAKDRYRIYLNNWDFCLEQGVQIDPRNHQRFHVLEAVACSLTDSMCKQPTIRQMVFYGEGDTTIGDYIYNLCQDAMAVCTLNSQTLHPVSSSNVSTTATVIDPSSSHPVISHYYTYVHGHYRVSIIPEQHEVVLDDPQFENCIVMWSFCKICQIITPQIAMSQETCRYSFARFLELCVCSKDRLRDASCGHSTRMDYVHYWMYQGITFQIHVDRINLYDIFSPPRFIRVRNETQIKLRNEEFVNLLQRNEAYWSSLLSRIRSFTTEKYRIVVAELEEKCHADRMEVTGYLHRVYKSISASHASLVQSNGLLDFIEVRRLLQNKVVEWELEWTNLDQRVLTSESRRLTAVQLKKVFSDGLLVSTPGGSASVHSKQLGESIEENEEEELKSVEGEGEKENEKKNELSADSKPHTTEKEDTEKVDRADGSLKACPEPPRTDSVSATADAGPQPGGGVVDKRAADEARPAKVWGNEAAEAKKSTAAGPEKGEPLVQVEKKKTRLSGGSEPRKSRSPKELSKPLPGPPRIPRSPRIASAPALSKTKHDEISPTDAETDADCTVHGRRSLRGKQNGSISNTGLSALSNDDSSSSEKKSVRESVSHMRGGVSSVGSMTPRAQAKSVAQGQQPLTPKSVVADLVSFFSDEAKERLTLEHNHDASHSRSSSKSSAYKFPSEYLMSGPPSRAQFVQSPMGEPFEEDLMKPHSTRAKSQELSRRSNNSLKVAGTKTPATGTSKIVKPRTPSRKGSSLTLSEKYKLFNAAANDTHQSGLMSPTKSSLTRMTSKRNLHKGFRLSHDSASNRSVVTTTPVNSITGKRVRTIAKHFSRLNRETQGDTHTRIQRFKFGPAQSNTLFKRRVRPVGSGIPSVRIFDNVKDAVEDDYEDSSEEEAADLTPSSSSDSDADDEYEVEEVEEVEDDAVSRPRDASEHVEALLDTPQNARDAETSGPAEEVPEPDAAPPSTVVTKQQQQQQQLTGRMASESEMSGNERGSIIRAISNLWSYKGYDLLPLDYPLLPTEHIFAQNPVLIREDEPSSFVSFSLCSNEYKEMMKRNAEERTAGGFDNTDEAILCQSGSKHVALQFEEGSTSFYCKIFFAEQFESLRRSCECDEILIRSLARCHKWDSSGGKSKVSFMETADKRFIIKEIGKFEMEALLRFAPAYFEYMSKALFHKLPTMLAKIFGFYRIGLKNSSTGKTVRLDVIVMENLHYNRDPTKKYDLKGSKRNRHVQVTKDNPNEVLMDENFLKISFKDPLYVREDAKRYITAAIHNDSLFLSKWNIMDYSLVVGVDDERQELVLGIVDFIRTYTWDKKLESWVKDSAFLGGGSSKPGGPTIVTPEQYKKRFREAMDDYFLLVPDAWYRDNAIEAAESAAAGAPELFETIRGADVFKLVKTNIATMQTNLGPGEAEKSKK